MKPKKPSKPVPKTTKAAIDAEILERINAKIAKAHQEIDSRGNHKVKPIKPEVKAGDLADPEPEIL
jgi:hypothetical protein